MSIESLTTSYEKMVEEEIYSFVAIEFNQQHAQFNSILPSVQKIIETENPDKTFRWSPPWKWSQCAKCKLSVNLFITGSVMVAAVAAGTTGPGAYAVWQALIIEAYGVAAWEAIKSAVFSASVDCLSKQICYEKGKCSKGCW